MLKPTLRKNEIPITGIEPVIPKHSRVHPRWRLAGCGDGSGGHSWGVLLASSGWRPGKLPNNLQYTGQAHSREACNSNSQWCRETLTDKPEFHPWAEERATFCWSTRLKRGGLGVVETTKNPLPPLMLPFKRLVSWGVRKDSSKLLSFRLLLKINWLHWISCYSLFHSQSCCWPDFLLKIFLMNVSRFLLKNKNKTKKQIQEPVYCLSRSQKWHVGKWPELDRLACPSCTWGLSSLEDREGGHSSFTAKFISTDTTKHQGWELSVMAMVMCWNSTLHRPLPFFPAKNTVVLEWVID